MKKRRKIIEQQLYSLRNKKMKGKQQKFNENT